MKLQRGVVKLVATCVVMLAFSPAAEPQTRAQTADAAYPVKPVRVIVPNVPGGGPDLIARALAPALSDLLGQQFVIDNRPGAGGRIAVELAARAEPGAYTILLGTVTTNAIQPIAFASMQKLDPASELTGVTQLAAIPTILVSGSNFPPNTLKELIAYASARPDQLNFSQVVGSASHLDVLELAARSGIKVVNVPSRGAGATVTGLIGGEIHFALMNAATAVPQIKGRRLKVFAIAANKRLPELPDVPTIAEAGYPGVGNAFWMGFFVPRETSRSIVSKLHTAVVRVMQRQDVQEIFARGLVPIVVSRSPEEFQAFVREEIQRWARIIQANNLKIE